MSNPTFPTPKVVIDRLALEKIRHFVNKDSQECSGMGITRVVGDTIYVDEIQMLEQRNGSAHTDINEDAVTKLMHEWRLKDGIINFWWHSHVNMSVFWSATDTATIKQLAQHGMCIASVFNKKGEIRTAVAAKITTPFADGPQIAIWDDLSLAASYKVDEQVKASWDAEHTSSVKRPPWVGSTGGSGGYHLSDSSGMRRYLDDEPEVFRFVETKDPEWWDSWVQRNEFDTDRLRAEYCSKRFEYRKSPTYMAELKEFLSKQTALSAPPGTALVGAGPAAGNGQPPRLNPNLSDEDRKRYHYAWMSDEIVQYDDQLKMFEMWNGVKIRAAWYMSDGATEFRIKCRERFTKVLLDEQKQIKVQGLREAKGLQLAEDEAEALERNLGEEIAQYERELRGETGDDIPNTNTLSEADVEALCSSSLAQ